MSKAENLITLETLLINALDRLKALDIICIPVAQLTSVTDIMIICTATSARHAKALSHHITTTLKTANIAACAEGLEEAEWVLIDAGDIIMHIMQAETRAFYDLERLWQQRDR